MTKQERAAARREHCKSYLRRGGDLPTAVALAAREGFHQNTSVWLGALGEILAEQGEMRPAYLDEQTGASKKWE